MKGILNFKLSSNASIPGFPNSYFQLLNIKYNVNAGDTEANVRS